MESLPVPRGEVQRQNVTTSVVKFHGDEIEATLIDGEVWVSLRRCCEAVGLSVAAQIVKLKAKSWAGVAEIATRDEGSNLQRITTMIDLDTLGGWLFSIDERKVKVEVRDKLVRYQKEAVKVLRRHFFGDAAKPPLGDTKTTSLPAEDESRLLVARALLWSAAADIAKVLRLAPFGEPVEAPPPPPPQVKPLYRYCEERGIESSWGQRVVWSQNLRGFCRKNGVKLGKRQKGDRQEYPIDLLDAFFEDVVATA